MSQTEIIRGAIPCLKCGVSIPPELFNQTTPLPCPSCGTISYTAVFPAFYGAEVKGKSGENVLTDEESTCFYHPSKRAASVCDGCGKFLCSLCHVELTNGNFCVKCIGSGVKKGKMANLQRARVLYDDIALSVATMGLLMFYFAIITTPTVFYLVIRHWKTPQSIFARRKWKAVFAILVSLVSFSVLAFLILTIAIA